ncbi:MAG: hypothetical protein KF884_07670 [Fimbriimonadaceae bacterium]|nr:hypothetical protein [Fimbriimonadaceae bacterium]QYK57428.1 MAG: hypothetical protein KF884_07670 [Fimbriimonadaceae bacterium]
MSVTSTFLRTLVLAASLIGFQSVIADYYVSSGTEIPPGKIYRLDDSGNVKGYFGDVALPIGIVFLDEDRLLVADFGSQSLRLIHADGTELGLFADEVDANALLVDSHGDILVNEYNSGFIRRFAQDGTDLGIFAVTGLQRQGQLAMDSQGNIYTSSFFPGEQLIYQYAPDGTFLGVFSSVASSGILSPTGLAFQSDGSMIVSNTFHNTLDRLDSSGGYLNQFAATGMLEPEWVTVEPDDSVFVPSWSGGWIEKYDAAGNDLGVFALLPHCYQIVRGPEVMAPNAVQVFRGRVNGGNLASLAEEDGDVLRVCRFIVLNAVEAPVQMELTGTTTVTSPTGLSVALTSKMATSGSFRQEMVLVDKNGAQSPTERRTDNLGSILKHVRLTVSGDPSDFVKADGTVKLRVNVRPLGPTAVLSWCYDIDRVAWTVRP